jgi:MerR family copper efflux transcriptional regulator
VRGLDLQVNLKVYAPRVTTGYKIKDVAERTGFTPATLRYYEDIGLLPPSMRTAAGYRTYDDSSLDRLAFIARAKQLGCSLGEIADLTLAWEGGRCGPVQDRLRAVVGDKLAATQTRVIELKTLASQLQQAAAALERHRPDGPCDDRCGCVATTPAQAAVVVSVDKPTEIACTLGPASLAGRVDEWRALLAHVERREPVDDGIRLTFAAATPVDELVRLTAAEQSCCAFFAFAITVDRRGLALEVRAPDDALPVVHSLFGDAETNH